MKMTKSEWRYKEMKQAMITENKEHSHDKEDSDALPKEYVARKKDTAAHGADVVPRAEVLHRKDAHEKSHDREKDNPAVSRRMLDTHLPLRGKKPPWTSGRRRSCASRVRFPT